MQRKYALMSADDGFGVRQKSAPLPFDILGTRNAADRLDSHLPFGIRVVVLFARL